MVTRNSLKQWTVVIVAVIDVVLLTINWMSEIKGHHIQNNVCICLEIDGHKDFHWTMSTQNRERFIGTFIHQAEVSIFCIGWGRGCLEWFASITTSRKKMFALFMLYSYDHCYFVGSSWELATRYVILTNYSHKGDNRYRVFWRKFQLNSMR